MLHLEALLYVHYNNNEKLNIIHRTFPELPVLAGDRGQKNIALQAISFQTPQMIRKCQKARYKIARLPGDSTNIKKKITHGMLCEFFMFLKKIFFLFFEIMIQLHHFTLRFPPSKYS